jgi:gamma-glutamyltranspeptidase/glutathione hydrolase
MTKQAIAFTSPHFLATQAGMDVMQRGGNAVDAMIAAAAMIAVAYPHMNGLGGDGFWLVHQPGQKPWAIDASGTAATAASPDWYAQRSLQTIPARGAPAALTMAGTVAGWQLAQDTWSAKNPAEQVRPIADLLAAAMTRAQDGIVVTDSLAAASQKVADELHGADYYQRVFTRHGNPLQPGETFRNPALAGLLEMLAEQGLQSFYRGQVAEGLAQHLSACGSPISLDDFTSYQAQLVTPLEVSIDGADIFNLPAPTQGFASLLLMACYDRLAKVDWSEVESIHALIEITKHVFALREQWIADPTQVPVDLQQQLSAASVARVAAEIDLQSVAQWPRPVQGGDTVWMGAKDADGTMVSFIQSLYWEFGSGVVVPQYGLVWNNRGSSFSLKPGIRQLAPRRKPFHTLNPSLLIDHNGERIAFGTMGGEGQPQTQAALMMRHRYRGQSLADAVSRPRWLLGRTWGDEDHGLKIENDLDADIVAALESRGHSITMVPPRNEAMGHAGMVKAMTDGGADAATDPRSDGLALTSG